MAFDTHQAEYGSSSAISWPASAVEQNTWITSAAIDNTSTKALDYLVQFEVDTPAGTAGDMKIGRFYVVGSVDNTNFSDGLAASTDGPTVTDPPNLSFLGVIHLRASSTTYNTPPWSVAGAFGLLVPPPYFFFAFHNRCNLTIASGALTGEICAAKTQVGT